MMLVNGGPDECIGNGVNDQGEHEGEVLPYVSASGASQSWRCVRHQRLNEERLRPILEANRRNYPDSDIPPKWFDPSYAGERWNEDD